MTERNERINRLVKAHFESIHQTGWYFGQFFFFAGSTVIAMIDGEGKGCGELGNRPGSVAVKSCSGLNETLNGRPA